MVAGEHEEKVELGGKEFECHCFLRENIPMEGSILFLKEVALSAHLPNLCVLPVPSLLYPASNQSSPVGGAGWEAV